MTDLICLVGTKKRVEISSSELLASLDSFVKLQKKHCRRYLHKVRAVLLHSISYFAILIIIQGYLDEWGRVENVVSM